MRALEEICHFRGDTAPIGFRIRDQQGQPSNIAGRTYRVTISRLSGPDAGQAAANQVAQVAGTITNAAAGELAIQFAASDFDGLTATDFDNGVARLHFDLEETDAGQVFTYGVGPFTLMQDLSK